MDRNKFILVGLINVCIGAVLGAAIGALIMKDATVGAIIGAMISALNTLIWAGLTKYQSKHTKSQQGGSESNA